jgi:hypothetical protein
MFRVTEASDQAVQVLIGRVAITYATPVIYHPIRDPCSILVAKYFEESVVWPYNLGDFKLSAFDPCQYLAGIFEIVKALFPRIPPWARFCLELSVVCHKILLVLRGAAICFSGPALLWFSTPAWVQMVHDFCVYKNSVSAYKINVPFILCTDIITTKASVAECKKRQRSVPVVDRAPGKSGCR